MADLDHDERWLLIERIVASAAFRKSGRLRDLLRHVARHSIFGDAAELSEQRIGQAVFAKPVDYSPTEDSSVRVHMRQLRLKLHEYFDSEGRHETLSVEIPKGSYALAFHNSPAGVLTEVLTPVEKRLKLPRPVIVLPWALTIVLAALCLFLWRREEAPKSPPVPWPLAEMFGNGYPTQIVVADVSWAMRRLMTQAPVSLDAYLRRDFLQRPQLPDPSDNEQFLAAYTANALLTSYADVAVATTFLKLNSPHMDRVSIRSGRDLRLRDLEEGNYIFIGSPASNPWVLLFENRLNFQEVRSDEVRGSVKYFVNRQPRPGEQATYKGLALTGQNGEDYATISVLPTDTRRGKVMIIQGLQQEGTEAAGLFLSDQRECQLLQKALGIQDEARRSTYFEALLRISAVGGSPTSTTIVANRVLQP
ncbi:MAG TPA: hypothetical protein VKR43_24385 [Bryobacteraceae bacterium]|nr:hypothetical protein [Bryobacteraceae bacterium]